VQSVKANVPGRSAYITGVDPPSGMSGSIGSAAGAGTAGCGAGFFGATFLGAAFFTTAFFFGAAFFAAAFRFGAAFFFATRFAAFPFARPAFFLFERAVFFAMTNLPIDTRHARRKFGAIVTQKNV
jgi:hypothetical protein